MWIDDATPENGTLVVVVGWTSGRRGCLRARPLWEWLWHRSFVYLLLSIDNMPHIYLDLLDPVDGEPWLAIASRKNLTYSA